MALPMTIGECQMNLDVNRLKDVLCATVESSKDSDGQREVYVFKFRDLRLHFFLQVAPFAGSVVFSADSSPDLSSCPIFEFTFLCTDINVSESAYPPIGSIAVYFFDRNSQERDAKLTLTPRSDGNWYIWANAISRPKGE